VQFGHPPVIEELAAAHGIAEVHLPVVAGVDVAHRRRDTALRHHGMRLAEQRLGDDRRLPPGQPRLDRRPQPRAARADHHHVVGEPLDVAALDVSHLPASVEEPRSLMVPLATNMM
jgi:hypothetical protein